MLRTLVACLGLMLATPAMAVPERGLDTTAPGEEPEPGANPIPKHRLYYSNAVFARVNPLGLINQLSLGYRLRLMDSDSVLFRDSYLNVGLSVRGSPAFGRIGARLDIAPIAVFRAWVTYEMVGYFGSFDQILGFATADTRYSDQTIADLGDNASAVLGSVLGAGATVQGKAGPVVIRSTFQITRYDLNVPDDSPFFYDQYWDRLAPNRGVMFLNDLDVLGLVGKVRVGARWTWSDAIVGDNDTVGGLAHHRVGPLFAYEFHDRGPGARFNKPTLFVLAQWWAQHPYRIGEEQPAALPLIALGLAFQGDLLGPKPPGRGKKK